MLKQIRKKSEKTNQNLEKIIRIFDSYHLQSSSIVDDSNLLTSKISLLSLVDDLKLSIYLS